MYESNVTDNDFQKSLIDSRNEDQILIPLYVIVCNQKYSVLDLDTIERRVTPYQFKVAFGTSNSVIVRGNNFPVRLLYNFNVESIFSDVNPITDIQTDYFILEESLFADVLEEDPILRKLYEDINNWIQLLYQRYLLHFDNEDKSKEEDDDSSYVSLGDELDYFE